jgi:PPE family/PPE-SVP subfamily C-terminal region
MHFLVLPPEINSALMYAGAGSGPLFVAAAAWEGLAAELYASASSFDSVITGLTAGPWLGAASVAMAAAAAPYASWLAASAAHAEGAAAQARMAAAAFDAARTATVHPAAVTANRVSLVSLIATNFLGQNTPAIAATEFDYLQMWAQDVAAMVGYHAGATSVASTLTPFAAPPVDLAGLASQVAGEASVAVQSLASGAPLQSLTSLAQIAMLPVSMLMSPMTSLAQGANAGTAGLADAASVPKFVDSTAAAMKPLGGGGAGLGGSVGASAGLGNARLVGAMSVPPTWQGSLPARLASSAMSGLGGETPYAAAAAGAPMGGMPMMPMPLGGLGGGGMPGGMLGRGGASPHVVQSRPSVVPRAGVG